MVRRVVPGPAALTVALFSVFGPAWLADLSGSGWFAFVSLWLFGAILIGCFAAVRHADAIAERLGEPLGTLVLTLAVTGIEVTLIAAVMYTGEGHATLARDAMFAVVMIVLNGLVGLSLIVGGLRHREQTYNLQGANAFLAVIVPIAVLGLDPVDITLLVLTLSVSTLTFASARTNVLLGAVHLVLFLAYLMLLLET